MGRKSFISWTAIERMMAAERRKEREENKAALIAAQNGDTRELDSVYYLDKVDFNAENRNTKIEIVEKKEYRTIVKYVTQNYVRYPIFSDWKTKTKNIKKSVKLTNAELESLNQHSDWLIKKFSSQIIVSLNDKNLLPSWFVYNVLKDDYFERTQKIDDILNKFISKSNNEIEKLKNSIKHISAKIENYKLFLEKEQKISQKLKNKITKIKNSKKSIIKSIFSLFLYDFFNSCNRLKKLSLLQEKKNLKISLIFKNIKYSENEILKINENIRNIKENISDKYAYATLLKRLEKFLYNKQKSLVKKLPTTCNVDNSFIPLKTIIGIDYQKIIGCYIIHNKENDKYYVGQSKDIYKRIKQHFFGTIPKNIIFAEDYYSSNFINKDELFELKIIPCATKDLLDKTEKELIEFYDSKNNGYNGTNGNT